MKTFKHDSSTNSIFLYKCTDGKLYQIFSFDSDTAVLKSAKNGHFAVAAKPYLDEYTNTLDYSSIEHFNTLKEAKQYKAKLDGLFNSKDEPVPQKEFDNEVVMDIEVKKSRSL